MGNTSSPGGQAHCDRLEAPFAQVVVRQAFGLGDLILVGNFDMPPLAPCDIVRWMPQNTKNSST